MSGLKWKRGYLAETELFDGDVVLARIDYLDADDMPVSEYEAVAAYEYAGKIHIRPADSDQADNQETKFQTSDWDWFAEINLAPPANHVQNETT